MSRPAYHTDRRHFLFDLLLACLAAVILGILARSFLVQVYTIREDSMRPTLMPGDRLLGNRVLFGGNVPFSDWKVAGIRKPGPKELVTFRHFDGSLYVKRVVASSGDSVMIHQKTLWVNGRRIELPGKADSTRVRSATLDPKDNFAPLRIPAAGDTLYLDRLKNRQFEFARNLYRQIHPDARVEQRNSIYINGKLQDRESLSRRHKLDWHALNTSNLDDLDWLQLQSILTFLTMRNPEAEIRLNRELAGDGKTVRFFVVPESCYFVMGDNWDVSYDSRYWGYVLHSRIQAKPFLILWSYKPNHPAKINFKRLLRIAS